MTLKPSDLPKHTGDADCLSARASDHMERKRARLEMLRRRISIKQKALTVLLFVEYQHFRALVDQVNHVECPVCHKNVSRVLPDGGSEVCGDCLENEWPDKLEVR